MDEGMCPCDFENYVTGDCPIHDTRTLLCRHEEVVFANGRSPKCTQCGQYLRWISAIQLAKIKED